MADVAPDLVRPTQPHRVYIGWDPNEIAAHVVATRSLRLHTASAVFIVRLIQSTLRAHGFYTRPTTVVDGQLFDVISQAPMSTEHAITRFFVPLLSDHRGWALFVDGDVLFRGDVADLFALADDRYAVMVVQHPPFTPAPHAGLPVLKKDGHVQLAYPRKNWSSVMLFNCGHPAHAALTLDALNTWPGRDLHAFTWLSDDLIGALPSTWNYLVGVALHPIGASESDIQLVHYTLGAPNLSAHRYDHFAEEWEAVARQAGFGRLPLGRPRRQP